MVGFKLFNIVDSVLCQLTTSLFSFICAEIDDLDDQNVEQFNCSLIQLHDLMTGHRIFLFLAHILFPWGSQCVSGDFISISFRDSS